MMIKYTAVSTAVSKSDETPKKQNTRHPIILPVFITLGLILLVLISMSVNPSPNPILRVSVDSYGAVGDGKTDDSAAFLAAWKDVCKFKNSKLKYFDDIHVVLSIPKNKSYLLSPLEFKGPCRPRKLTLELAGTLLAPPNPNDWPTRSNAWLSFKRLQDFTLTGGGTLNGQGQQWWDQSCKRTKSNTCRNAPTAIMFSNSHNIEVRNIKSLDSPQIHFTFSNVVNAHASHIVVLAPPNSPNTDGIHISSSQQVLVESPKVETGDDCVSIVGDSKDIVLRNLACGIGTHGISVGSLGKEGDSDHVSNVLVDGARLTSTTNGLRIKTWKGGQGYAKDITFRNIKMNNVRYPIIIDQEYFDSSINNQPFDSTSDVQISNIKYEHIHGTYVATALRHKAIKLACSVVAPCAGLQFNDIQFSMNHMLKSSKALRESRTFCQNAHGTLQGTIVPSLQTCLNSHSLL